MIIFLLIVIGLFLVLILAQFWYMHVLVGKNEELRLEADESARNTFHDLERIALQRELIDHKEEFMWALLKELEDAYLSIELLVADSLKNEDNFEAAMEMVLNGA